jgi:drug/metabolite transporter (DMT)-like permease
VALVGYGLFTFVIGNPLLLWSLQLGGVLIATPVSSTQALWGALLAALFLKQSLNGKMLGGILVSIAGIVVLALGQNPEAGVSQQWLLSVPLALGTAVSWSFSGVIMTYTIQRGVDRFHSLALSVGVGVLALNAVMLMSGQLGAYTEMPLSIYGALLIAGVLNALALVSITTALVYTSVATAMTLNSLQIALGPLLAWIFLGEQLGPVTGLGALLVAAGAVVVQRAAPAPPVPREGVCD